MKDKKEIIILALGPSRNQCPYDAEVWSLNMGYQQIATDHGRIDKIFMVHTQVYSAEGNPYFDWEHFRQLREAGCELFNIHRVKGVPFRKYPLERIVRKLNLNYFSNTISYMIAYALYKYTKVVDGKLVLKQPLKLRLYGVDMWEGSEYKEEKGGIECWIGYALGLGVDVTISAGSSLLLPINGYSYGLTSPPNDYFDIFKLLKREKGEVIKPLTAEEINKAVLNRQKVRLQFAKYRGEFAEGTHRESLIPMPNDMPESAM